MPRQDTYTRCGFPKRGGQGKEQNHLWRKGKRNFPTKMDRTLKKTVDRKRKHPNKANQKQGRQEAGTFYEACR